MMTRRRWLASSAAAPLLRAQSPAANRPNILWVTCEDTGPNLNALGDRYSVTPTLDKLCANGYAYRNAWSNAPVCAPARTTIISGLYPPSTGSEHMRSETRLAPGMKMFPQFLREAGYYTSNNNKEDYNLVKPGQVWDDSSTKAHWRNRAANQPFFSIFNFTTTHESQIRKRPHTLVHDPAGVRVPAYHPDTPEVRHDWAQYYDNITTMDGQAAKVLKELADDGLANDTIVFFYGDHGSGMPRSKRYPYNSGLNVSIVVSVPEKFRHLAPKGYKAGESTGRLVGFVDLAPTVLSIAGMQAAPYHQGHAFMGQHAQPEQEFAFGFRGRMDERYDLMRTVRDKRYVYIRNYMPHKIYGQHVNYMFQTPTTAVWRKMYDEKKLNEAQRRFWETKPAEELYDLQSDPDEVKNLAASPAHSATVKRLKSAQEGLAARIRDVGFLPENEIHSRAAAASSTPYEVGHDAAKYPLERIHAMASAASNLRPGVEPLHKGLKDPDSAVRYWAALGIVMRGALATRASLPELKSALQDPAPAVAIAAAEALGRWGSDEDAAAGLAVLAEYAHAPKHGQYVAMAALNGIDAMEHRAAPLRDRVKEFGVVDPNAPRTTREYITRLVEHIEATLSPKG